MKSNLLSLLFLLFFTACVSDEELPDDVIPSETMIPVLMDMHIAEAVKEYSKLPPTDSTTWKMSQEYYEIFERYDVDAKQFFYSFNYYLDHPEKMDDMYVDLLEELNKEAD